MPQNQTIFHELMPWDALVGDADAFWVECFSCVGVTSEKCTKRRWVFGDVYYILVSGALQTPISMHVRLVSMVGDKVEWLVRDVRPEQLADGVYALFATPICSLRFGGPDDHEETSGRIEAVTGLITSAGGPFAALDKVFRTALLADGGYVKRGNESHFVTQQPPELSDNRLEGIAAGFARMRGPERDRVKLALRWADQGRRAVGVDAFLKAWFALEALGITSGTNVNQIEARLERIYGRGRSDVKETFRLGRVHGIRGKIAHGQQMNPPHPKLANYILAVFDDILLDALGVPSQRRALSMILEPGAGCDIWLP